MSLTISAAATLTNNTIASGDLIPVSDISAVSGSKGSHITAGNLKINILSGVVTTSDVGTVTSGMLADSIPYSKLNLTGFITNNDLVGSISQSKISNLTGDLNTLTLSVATKAETGIYVSGSGLATGGGYLTGNQIISVPIATSGDAVTGTDNTLAMTPLRVAQAIAALASGGSSNPDLYSLSPATGIFTTASSYNHRGIIRNTLTGSGTLFGPNGGSDGKILTFWLTASGANRALTFNTGQLSVSGGSSLIFPTEYTLTNPTTITSGNKRVVSIQYDATLAQWEVLNNLGDY